MGATVSYPQNNYKNANMSGVKLLYYANIYLWESLGNTSFHIRQDLGGS